MKIENKVIESFKDLENQKTLETDSVKNTMKSIFEEYKTTSFKQSDFSKKLKKRTQHINQVLKVLLEEGKIVREGSRKQYYYRLK